MWRPAQAATGSGCLAQLSASIGPAVSASPPAASLRPRCHARGPARHRRAIVAPRDADPGILVAGSHSQERLIFEDWRAASTGISARLYRNLPNCTLKGRKIRWFLRYQKLQLRNREIGRAPV